MSWIQEENKMKNQAGELINGLKDTLQAHGLPDELFIIKSELSPEKYSSLVRVGVNRKKLDSHIINLQVQLEKATAVKNKATELKLLMD